MLFLDVQTQWRVAATMTRVHYVGLDYAAVEALLRARRTPKRAELIEGLQVMEFAALKGLNRHD